MRRIGCFLLALCFCFLFCSCGDEQEERNIIEVVPASEEMLYQHGLDLAALLEEMVGSEQYMGLYTASDTVREALAPVAGKSLAEPQGVYQVVLSADASAILMEDVDLDAFSPELQSFLLRRMHSSVPSVLNSFSGAETLAAASICTVSQAYVGETIEENCFYIYLYDSARPVIVSYNGDGAHIEASAAFLLGHDGVENSMEAVSELFGGTEVEGVHVKKIDINKE